MTKAQLMAIACLPLLAVACSSGGGKGSTGTVVGGTGTVPTTGTTTSASSSGGAGTGAPTGGSAGSASAGVSTSTGTGGAMGGSSSGTTTGPSAPNFALTAMPDTLTLAEGGQQTIRIDIERDAGGTLDTDTLIFGLVSDGGVTGVFAPLETAGDATALTISTEASVPAGTYSLTVVASSSSNRQAFQEVDISLTVSSEVVTTLLVDNDDSQNNADGGGIPSVSDTLFAQELALAGIPFNTFVIPSTGDTFDGTVVANYSTVVWYSGANNSTTGNGSLSSADEQFLEMWLDQGNKRLLMFAPYLVQDLEPFHFWGDTPSDQFLSLYVGAQGCDQNPQQLFDGQSFVASGVDGTPFGLDGGQVFQITPTPIPDTASVINPGDGGTAPLVTVAADELGIGVPQAIPCTVINNSAGQAGTSTVVLVGIPIEDIQALDAGSPDSFFSALEQSLP
jgi:hypothetical protein